MTAIYDRLGAIGDPGVPQATHLTFEQRSLAVLEQILAAAKETNVILGALVAQRTEESGASAASTAATTAAVVAKVKKK